MRKKNSGNRKENNRSLSTITHSKICIIIIPSHIPCSGLFFDSQINTYFLQGNHTTLFTLHLQCNKQIVKIQNNIVLTQNNTQNFYLEEVIDGCIITSSPTLKNNNIPHLGWYNQHNLWYIFFFVLPFMNNSGIDKMRLFFISIYRRMAKWSHASHSTWTIIRVCICRSKQMKETNSYLP